jgi:hypothetical protein
VPVRRLALLRKGSEDVGLDDGCPEEPAAGTVMLAPGLIPSICDVGGRGIEEIGVGVSELTGLASPLAIGADSGLLMLLSGLLASGLGTWTWPPLTCGAGPPTISCPSESSPIRPDSELEELDEACEGECPATI